MNARIRPDEALETALALGKAGGGIKILGFDGHKHRARFPSG